MPAKEGKTMANWFKMYENGLDEPRMKYAIQKNPNTVAVWIWILTECCRNRSDQFDYSKFVQFGASQTINMPESDVVSVIDILHEIGYIVLSDDSIKVPKWNERQSEYCRKKNNKQIVSGECQASVRLEESRGEEEESHTVSGYSKDFLAFWEVYPKKIAKGDAFKAWKKAKAKPELEALLSIVNRQAQWEQWRKDGGQYIPNGATWLNGKRWDDEETNVKPNNNAGMEVRR